MNKMEAIVAMTNGHRVRNTDWQKEEYIYYEANDEQILDEKEYSWDINKWLKGSWEIYVEPKDRVTMYKFARIERGMITETKGFYKDIESIKTSREDRRKYIRLDYTATEFEIEE